MTLSPTANSHGVRIQISLLALLVVGMIALSTIGCDNKSISVEDLEPFQLGKTDGYQRIKWETETLGPVLYSNFDLANKSQGRLSNADLAALGRMEDRRLFLMTARNNLFSKGYTAQYFQYYLLGFNEGVNQYIQESSGQVGLVRNDFIDVRSIDVPVRINSY